MGFAREGGFDHLFEGHIVNLGQVGDDTLVGAFDQVVHFFGRDELARNAVLGGLIAQGTECFAIQSFAEQDLVDLAACPDSIHHGMHAIEVILIVFHTFTNWPTHPCGHRGRV